MTWHKIADTLAELPLNEAGLAELEVSGKKICVALVNKQLVACAPKCPHAGGNLAHGYTDALGNIVCPLHRYKFNLQTGRNTSGEGYFLKTYPVEQRPDGVYVGIKSANLFNW